MIDPTLDETWKNALWEEFQKPYFHKIKETLLSPKAQPFFPPGKEIFAALDHCPLDKVKVVILGQDPYHGKGQAHGLSFSVNHGVAIPPSLRNIYAELESDLGLSPPNHGYLLKWAEEGVLLLNASLTVKAHEANSHAGIGWHTFTDAVIKCVNDTCDRVVFMLWGRFAGQKASLIDGDKHLVLTAPHPSPFSAHTGFLGCKHFSKANAWLEENRKTAIDWSLS